MMTHMDIPHDFSAKIILDSISPTGQRLTTFQVTYPRFILAEVNTHRVFSRNTASSRAIPSKKLIDHVRRNGYIPSEVAVNKAGMQAGEPLSLQGQEDFANIWGNARTVACDYAEQLLEVGAHKQWVNRLIEPYMWTTQLISSTDYSNFFDLRDHEAAQPEIQTVARLMRKEFDSSTPTKRTFHIPFTEGNTWAELGKCYGVWQEIPEILDLVDQVSKELKQWAAFNNEFTVVPMLLSAARCARLSYVSHDSTKIDYRKDAELVLRLAGSNPRHLSPFEHQAAIDDDYDYHSNFCGWAQLRSFIK